MRKTLILAIFVALLLTTGGVALNNKPAVTLKSVLSSRFDRYYKFNSFSISGQPLYSPILLSRFYENRSFVPAWVDEKGILPAAQDLMASLQQSYRDGLQPKDYHWEIIQDLNNEVREIEMSNRKMPASLLINLELLFTDAFLTYGSHLLAGRINPTAIDELWLANRRDANLAEVLEDAFSKNNIRGMLEKLYPPQPMYHQMRDALARYGTFEKNDDWPIVEDGAELKQGDQDPRVIVLRKRLLLEGDYNRQLTDSDIFDQALEGALQKFQERYGLIPDGVLKAEDLKALQVPIKERVAALRLNLERCRWLPDSLGQKYVAVNVADYRLEVIENNRPVETMRAIVGKRYRKTPVFSSTITHVVTNPYWNVPQRIAVLDILPKVQHDVSYLTQLNFEVYAPSGDGMKKIDPAIIDWSSIGKENFGFHLRQNPGPQNALGQFKFIFPNQFDVYLHDTPSRNLFDNNIRTFSSGCVRIEKPVELAKILLHLHGKEGQEEIASLLNSQSERYVRLPEPMPVHIMYWTAWVDYRGRVHFREDIYERDIPLQNALNQDLLVYVPE